MSPEIHAHECEPTLRTRLEPAPPSAKLVYYVLDVEGPATPSQLAEATLLAPRTIRSALDTLDDLDLVVDERYVPDARKRVYYAIDP